MEVSFLTIYWLKVQGDPCWMRMHNADPRLRSVHLGAIQSLWFAVIVMELTFAKLAHLLVQPSLWQSPMPQALLVSKILQLPGAFCWGLEGTHFIYSPGEVVISDNSRSSNTTKLSLLLACTWKWWNQTLWQAPQAQNSGGGTIVNYSTGIIPQVSTLKFLRLQNKGFWYQ